MVGQATADYWMDQPGEKLFHETFNATDDADTDPTVPDDRHLPNWRDFSDGIYLEGFELHKGSLDVFDEENELVYEARMDTQQFWDRHVDDLKAYTEESILGLGSSVFTGLVSYSGKASIDVELPGKFDPKLLLLHVVQLPETIHFISKVFCHGIELDGVDGSGKYNRQCAALYVEGKPPVVHAD